MVKTPDNARITRALWVCVGVLLLASTLGHIANHVWAGSRVANSARMVLDVDDERNLPTWFASSLLLMIAVNLWLLGAAWRSGGRRHEWRWSMLALAALAMSAEEVVGIHERFMGPLRALLGTSGVFYYAWVIPAMILAACVCLLSVRLILGLDRASRNRFIIAGAIYLTGALGFEMIGGAFAPPPGEARPAFYLAIATTEEALEMAGLVLAFGAVFRLREGLADTASADQGESRRPGDAPGLDAPERRLAG